VYGTRGAFAWIAKRILRLVFHIVITDDIEVGHDLQLVHSGWNVGLGARTTLGDRVRIFPFAVIAAGDPLGRQRSRCIVGDDVVLGLRSTVMVGEHDLVIAPGTILGACALLTTSITEPGGIWVGQPARLLRRRADWPPAGVSSAGPAEHALPPGTTGSSDGAFAS
jgi:acetyltransferase-like isoleucine patch superfamily enzyme